MPEPLFAETLQVSLVVHDLDAALRTDVRGYGIGPWEIDAEFLPSRGEGLHHVGVGVHNDGEALQTLRDKGHSVLQGGRDSGVTFACLSTDRDLGVITGMFD